MKFNEFNLSERLQGVLTTMGYGDATDVQSQAIPLILEGRDILASSQTGTGKTGAFLIPLISMIEDCKNKDVLIVTPTRELAKQVYTVANQMMGFNNNGFDSGDGNDRCGDFRRNRGGRNRRRNSDRNNADNCNGPCALLIGGEDMKKQINQLKRNPRIIIGTPGRINDHLGQKTLSLKHAHYLVLDETDRMLDMGFGVQIDEILKFMPEERQTALFSATLPKAIIKLSAKYLKNPERVAIGDMNSIVEKITQNIIHTEQKFEVLLEELAKTVGSALVFVRTQRNAEDMKYKLKDQPYITDALHGGLRQSKRSKVMSAFRGKRCNVLVATDVASRGLDVKHIEHVINYDMPDNPEDYIHRVGRTARAGEKGLATSLVSRGDKHKLRAVERFLKGDEDGMDEKRNSSRRNRPARSSKKSSSSNGDNSSDRSKKRFGERKSFGDGRSEEKPENRSFREGFSRDKRRSDDRKSAEGFGRGKKRFDDRNSEKNSFGESSNRERKRFNNKESSEGFGRDKKRFSDKKSSENSDRKTRKFGGLFGGKRTSGSGAGKSFGGKKFGDRKPARKSFFK